MALTDQLISFWELGEASGTRFDSVVASANDLTDNNTVTSNTGKVGDAAQFTQANTEYLSRADNASLSVGDIDFTLAGWIYHDSIAASLRTLISKDDVGTNREYILALLPPSSRMRFTVFGSSSGGNRHDLEAISFGSLSTGTWYFVVAWHDSVANTINIQVNNGTVDSLAHSTGVYDGAAAVNIGSVAATADYCLNGRADQVGFWKRVLTADERTQLYNSGNGLSYAAMAPSAVFRNSRFARQAVKRASFY